MVYRRRVWTARPRVGHEALPVRRSKYGVDLTATGKAARTLNGVVFKSKAEKRYAEVLTLRQRAGEVVTWAYEARSYPLLACGPEGQPVKIGRYTPDFTVVFPDDTIELVEVKGRSTVDFRLREKLFRACYPDIPLRVVSANDV